MEEILTKEMKEAIAALGALIKADERNTAVVRAIDEYEHSEELTSIIGEYNTQQNILADAYGNNNSEGQSEEFKKAVQDRIDDLYVKITTHPVYTAYMEAKSAFEALSSEVYSELQYQITGSRPCTHDCSSCHSDCASRG